MAGNDRAATRHRCAARCDRVLQGADLIASDLEREILPARVADYQSVRSRYACSLQVKSSGSARAPLGARDGRVSLYFDRRRLAVCFRRASAEQLSRRPFGTGAANPEFLREQGASFQATIHQAVGGGFPNETPDALVGAGVGRPGYQRHVPSGAIPVVLDGQGAAARVRRAIRSAWLARRLQNDCGAGAAAVVSAEDAGRLLSQRVHALATPTEWSAATAQQLLARSWHRDAGDAAAENVPGGYAAIYPALKTMEESGWIRRGMFVAGMGAAQFATPKAVDMLRSLRMESERPEAIHLAASDPANPYGSLLPWVEGSTEHSMARAAGANVILVNGRLAAFFRRRNPALRRFFPMTTLSAPESQESWPRSLRVAIRHQTKRGGFANFDYQRRACRRTLSRAISGGQRIRPDSGGIPDAPCSARGDGFRGPG